MNSIGTKKLLKLAAATASFMVVLLAPTGCLETTTTGTATGGTSTGGTCVLVICL